MNIQTKNRIDDLVSRHLREFANIEIWKLYRCCEMKSDLSKEFDNKDILDYLILNLEKLFNI